MENKQIYEQISFENIEKYRSFDSVAEMDGKIYEYIEILRTDEHPESVIEVLLFLGRSSLRCPGVSFPKYQTIADGIGMSMSTVKRAIRTLKDYGIIETIPTTKKWLGRGKSRRKSVNIIVILSSMNRQNEPSNEDVKRKQDKPNKVENETEPSNNNHLKNTLKATGIEGNTGSTKHPRALRQAIPEVIYDGLAPFFDANGLYKTYGILLRAKAMIDRNRIITLEQYGEQYVDVFLNVIRKYKLGQVRKSFDGLLYTAWSRLTAELSRKKTVNEHNGLFYDWLNNSDQQTDSLTLV